MLHQCVCYSEIKLFMMTSIEYLSKHRLCIIFIKVIDCDIFIFHNHAFNYSFFKRSSWIISWGGYAIMHVINKVYNLNNILDCWSLLSNYFKAIKKINEYDLWLTSLSLYFICLFRHVCPHYVRSNSELLFQWRIYRIDWPPGLW